MNHITYEQFATCCKHYNYTTHEGYKAMCFAANIIGEYYSTCIDHVKKVSRDSYHSDALKSLVDMNLSDARILLTLYNNLDCKVFDMLEKHKNDNSNKE